MTVVIDPASIATTFRQQLRSGIAELSAPLNLVGVLAGEHGPSSTYAQYAAKACAELGAHFELRRIARLEAEAELRRLNADAHVHGIMVYYPVFGTEQDAYLRDLVEPAKDIEGLHSVWARNLYDNRRFLDPEKTKKSILPCTPLAILKLVEAAGHFATQGRVLEGRRVCIFNRSEVVGRPLASMMAHDGAQVFSFDIDGVLRFSPGASRDAAHEISESNVDRAEALRSADIVITGVPSKTFALVCGDEIREGALCINFSTRKNFDDSILGKASVFVPRVGPMTVLMALRNALRLYYNARADG